MKSLFDVATELETAAQSRNVPCVMIDATYLKAHRTASSLRVYAARDIAPEEDAQSVINQK